MLIGAVSMVFVWGLTATWGTSNIEAFLIALSKAGMSEELVVIDDAREAVEMVSRGFDAPRWLYVGNSNSPFPMIVSVDIDFVRTDTWWSPQRLYFFWCCGLHTTEPFYSRQVEHAL